MDDVQREDAAHGAYWRWLRIPFWLIVPATAGAYAGAWLRQAWEACGR